MSLPRRLPPSTVRLEGGALVFTYKGDDLLDPLNITGIPIANLITADAITDAASYGRAIIRNPSGWSIRTTIGSETTSAKGQPSGYVPLEQQGKVSSLYANDIVDEATSQAITFAIFQLGE